MLRSCPTTSPKNPCSVFFAPGNITFHAFNAAIRGPKKRPTGSGKIFGRFMMIRIEVLPAHTVITVADEEEGSEKRLILDGQQRTTTILALLSAFVAAVDEHDVNGSFLGQRDLIDKMLHDQYGPRLTTEHDADKQNLAFLQTRVLDQPLSGARRSTATTTTT